MARSSPSYSSFSLGKYHCYTQISLSALLFLLACFYFACVPLPLWASINKYHILCSVELFQTASLVASVRRPEAVWGLCIMQTHCTLSIHRIFHCITYLYLMISLPLQSLSYQIAFYFSIHDNVLYKITARPLEHSSSLKRFAEPIIIVSFQSKWKANCSLEKVNLCMYNANGKVTQDSRKVTEKIGGKCTVVVVKVIERRWRKY